MAEKNKCAHPGCTCAPSAGSKYCSKSCADAGNTMESSCSCGHQGCGTGASAPKPMTAR